MREQGPAFVGEQPNRWLRLVAVLAIIRLQVELFALVPFQPRPRPG